MDASLADNPSITMKADIIVTEPPLTNLTSTPAGLLFDAFTASKEKLCFIAYKGANTIKLKWFLVQVDLSRNSDGQNTGIYCVDFFRYHPSDSHKSHDCARYWPDWYEIKWTDDTHTVFDYGKPILARPNRSPNVNDHCRFSDLVALTNKNIFLVGPFDFESKSHTLQIVSYKHWGKLSSACHAIGIVPPKLANDPVTATHTIAIAKSTNSVKWYNSSI